MRRFCKREEGMEGQITVGGIHFDSPPSLSSELCSLLYFCVGPNQEVTLYSSGSSLLLSNHIFPLSHSCEAIACCTFLTSMIRGPHNHSPTFTEDLGACFRVQLSALVSATPGCDLNFQVHSPSSIPAPKPLNRPPLHFHKLTCIHTWPPLRRTAPLRS